ncbi:MAG: PCMD domain-containing protein [Muribaculaceae bacterium]|nr:PCMD domain-containing protein [Muribaculaceae bacterium]MDE5968381.1 PCMD domain-containing protein [Muribaculaceae bacterium]
MKRIISAAIAALLLTSAMAQRVETINFGNFNQWITRNIPESAIIGGNTKTIYEIGPNATIDGAKAYSNQGGSPWATSNVYAKVSGVKKASCAVYPDTRSAGNRCAKLVAQMENVKAIGIISMDVMVGGSMFLGKMLEPVTSTSNPYSKMEMGVPFTGRPSALRFDYKTKIPNVDYRTYSSGFGRKKQLPGRDNGEVFILLQRRWEDADGNLHATRVATGREVFNKSTGWINSHDLKLNYGDISSLRGTQAYKALIPKDKSYYARNSKGKMVPVVESGWETDPNAAPTHMILMFSASSGEPYTATEGLTLWIDNVALVY